VRTTLAPSDSCLLGSYLVKHTRQPVRASGVRRCSARRGRFVAYAVSALRTGRPNEAVARRVCPRPLASCSVATSARGALAIVWLILLGALWVRRLRPYGVTAGD
jgi:MYXO-CTERM domain-containing protein